MDTEDRSATSSSLLTSPSSSSPRRQRRVRYVYAGRRELHEDCVGNEVITARYSFASFLPVFLLEQFSRGANVYFLMVCVLQMVPSISLSAGIPTAALPLLFVLAFDGVIAAVEDAARHRDDRITNGRMTRVGRGEEFEEVRWEEVRVGDVLEIRRDEPVPADCVLLGSDSSESGGKTPADTCYVETAQLDGETNLKLKKAPHKMAEFGSRLGALGFRGCVTVDLPGVDVSFSSFNATIESNVHVEHQPLDSDPLSLSTGAEGAIDLPTPPLTSTPPSSPSTSSSIITPIRVPGSGAAGGKGEEEEEEEEEEEGVLLGSGGWSAGSSAEEKMVEMEVVSEADSEMEGVWKLEAWCRRKAPAALVRPPSSRLWHEQREAGVPVDESSLLLRGSEIRGVDSVFAVVVYTGTDTKARVRQAQASSNRSVLSESLLNQHIVVVALLLLTACAIGASLYASWIQENQVFASTILLINKVTVGGIVGKIFTFALLNSGIIPIALYVTIRAARTVQKLLMEADRSMLLLQPPASSTSSSQPPLPPTSTTLQYSLGSGWTVDPMEAEVGALRVRNMEVCDEIGYITHVFSDKTGTLTLNSMALRSICVAGVVLGVTATTTTTSSSSSSSTTTSSSPSTSASPPSLVGVREAWEEAAAEAREDVVSVPFVRFRDGSPSHPDRSLATALRESKETGTANTFAGLRYEGRGGAGDGEGDGSAGDGEGSAGSGKVEFGAQTAAFLLHLALNHSVIPEVKPDGSKRLSAASPDEEAFVSFASAFGVQLSGRTDEAIVLEEEGGEKMKVSVLHAIAYTQMRKRMSVVVRLPSGAVYVLCKGADSALWPRLREPTSTSEREEREQTRQALLTWAREGLRTLVFAAKKISEEDLDAWAGRWMSAMGSHTERSKRKDGLPNAIDELAEEMEQGFELQGATAVEDRLQPGVPESLAMLSRAGVRTWMLTGDKTETAVNIAQSSRLIDDNTERILCAAGDAAGGAATGAAALLAYAMRNGFNLVAALNALQTEAAMNPDAARIGEEALLPSSPRRRRSLSRTFSPSAIRRPTSTPTASHSPSPFSPTSPQPQLPPTAANLLRSEILAHSRAPRPPGPCSRFYTIASDWMSWLMRAVDTASSPGISKRVEKACDLPALERAMQVAADNELPPVIARATKLDDEGLDQARNYTGCASLSSPPSPSEIGEYAPLSDAGGGMVGDGEGTGGVHVEGVEVGEEVEVEEEVEVKQRVAVVVDERVIDVLLHHHHEVSVDEKEADDEDWNEAEAVVMSQGHGGVGTMRDDVLTGVDSLRDAFFGVYRAVFGSRESEEEQSEVEEMDSIANDAAMLLRDSGVKWLLRAQTRTAIRLRKAILLAALGSANAVIACRCRPDQKAALVRLVSRGKAGARCLAIGDGANDVPMIQQANVGVGIAGREGGAAVNAADIAISRFRFIVPLLLVHGRSNARRVAKLINYMVYKCVVLYTAQSLYSVRNTGSSGQKFVPELASQFFNVLYSALPVLVVATLEEDLPPQAVLQLPQLYHEGRGGAFLSTSTFLSFILSGFIDAIIAYSIPTLALPSPTIFELGSAVFTAVLLLISLRIAHEAHAHSIPLIVALLISTIIWPFSLQLYDSLDVDGIRGTANHLLNSPSFYLFLPVVAMLGLGRMAVARAFKRALWPDLRQVAAELTWFGGGVEQLANTLESIYRSGGHLRGALSVPKAEAEDSSKISMGIQRRLRRRWRGGGGGGGFDMDERAAQQVAEQFSKGGKERRKRVRGGGL